jgi:hypothetical protein
MDIKMDLKEYEGITGEIVLSVPTYMERLKLIKGCGFRMDAKGEVGLGDEDGFDAFIKLVESSKKYYKKVDVKIDEVRIRNFDGLEQNPKCDSLISNAASLLLHGGKLGKSKRPS